jgi:putative restriction endonuclease
MPHHGSRPCDGLASDGAELDHPNPVGARKAIQAVLQSGSQQISNVVYVIRPSVEVKRLHNHRCRVCGIRSECTGGPYAEAAHIRPLARRHNGPDGLANLLCLCPNHHVLFDNGALQSRTAWI